MLFSVWMVLRMYMQCRLICTSCGNEHYIKKFTFSLSGQWFHFPWFPNNMQSLTNHPVAWWLYQKETFSALLAFCTGKFTGRIPITKASGAELWCFLWSVPGYTVGQTIVRLVIWEPHRWYSSTRTIYVNKLGSHVTAHGTPMIAQKLGSLVSSSLMN